MSRPDHVGAGSGAGPDLVAAIERARRSPFYAKHLAGHTLRSRDELPALPLTMKHHLRDASPFGMLCVPPSKTWHYHESSGTTGEPISTWCGLEELRGMADLLVRMVPELSQDTILLNRFPLFAPVSFVFEEALRLTGACHLAAGNMTWDVPFDRVVGFIRKLGVTALGGLPLEPVLLREVALAQGLDLARDLGSLRVIFCGGAVLPPSLRRILERDWNARVVEIYGSNETMGLGLSCVRGRLHLCTDLVEVEVLDPVSWSPVPPGQPGILTVTSLVHEVMPLVRYVTGDLVRVDPTPCACGHPGPTADVLGRYDDVIELPGGRTTHYEVLDAAYDLADRLDTRIFFVLVRRRGLHVLMEVDDPEAARRSGAERGMGERVGVPIEVEYLGRNEVLDRTAMFRAPKIYKPSLIADWRGEGRKPITVMEALLEWPKFDLRTIAGIVRREIRNRRRRARLLRLDAAP